MVERGLRVFDWNDFLKTLAEAERASQEIPCHDSKSCHGCDVFFAIEDLARAIFSAIHDDVIEVG